MSTINPVVTIPSPREFGLAWKSFFATISAIITYRTIHAGPRRFGELSEHAARLLSEAAESEGMQSQLAEMLGDEHERVPLGILYEEMIYITYKYRTAFELANVEMPEIIETLRGVEQFSDVQGDPGAHDAVDEAEIVAGSIQPLLDKLPKWIRKAIDVILEVLKLTKGIVH